MKKRSSKSILFLGKINDPHTKEASLYLKNFFTSVEVYLGDWGDPFPNKIHKWEGDYIISYLSRWVLPKSIINSSSEAAINFHPASPEYPGIGCNNFALYENSKTYGATCHHMTESVDSGDIVAVSRFNVEPSDNVSSLLEKTYDHQFKLFKIIIKNILDGTQLPSSKEKWTRKPFTRSDFNDLCVITPEMSEEEIAKRIRATSYKDWQPTLKIGKFSFEYKEHE